MMNRPLRTLLAFSLMNNSFPVMSASLDSSVSSIHETDCYARQTLNVWTALRSPKPAHLIVIALVLYGVYTPDVSKLRAAFVQSPDAANERDEVYVKRLADEVWEMESGKFGMTSFKAFLPRTLKGWIQLGSTHRAAERLLLQAFKKNAPAQTVIDLYGLVDVCDLTRIDSKDSRVKGYIKTHPGFVPPARKSTKRPKGPAAAAA